METRLILQGRLLPDKTLQEDEDLDVEDEEDEVPFVDSEGPLSDGVQAGGLPSRLPVLIKDENTTEEFQVFGRFPLVGPWWKVKVRVKPVGSRYFAFGLPSYFLLKDLPPEQKDVCSLFLQTWGFSADFVSEFLKWVYLRFHNLSFANLQEALRNFTEWKKKISRKKESSQRKDGSSSQDKNEVLLSKIPITLKIVMIALRFPRIMEFIPVLLPRHFHKLLNLEHPESLYRNLEGILNTCPWKLGFSRINYRELKLIGCEATWQAFCQCEFLLQKINNVEKNALITYNHLTQICRMYGHTYVKEDDLTSQLSGKIAFQDVWWSLKFLKDIEVVTNEKECIFLIGLYEAERDIASLVHDLMTTSSWKLKVDVKKVLASMETKKSKCAGDNAINTSKPQEEKSENFGHVLDEQSQVFHSDENKNDFEIPSHIQVDQDQVTALEMICSNAVTVISGKGGCGKTTIVSHLFKHLEQMEKAEVRKACEDFARDLGTPEELDTFVHQSKWKDNKRIEVLLTAPTGKAASLLREKTCLPAYTLHQVKYSFYSWQKIVKKLEENMESDKKIFWKFASVRVLVVDEGSLVGITVFRSVLNLLRKYARLEKLIILGDIRQLPSIEPGNLLKDLFEILKLRNCAVELKTNHRAESQLIVDNAARISTRQFPKFDAELIIADDLTSSIPGQTKKFIFVRLPEVNSHSQSSQGNYRSYLHSAVTTLLKGAAELKNAKTSQFIAFRKQDCDLINDCCCNFYSNHLHKNHKHRFIFQKGDKICCTRNAYLSDLITQNSDCLQNEELELVHAEDPDASKESSKKSHIFEKDIRLCNGEIFFITNDVQNENGRFLTINNMAGLEVTVDFQKLADICHIRHAWAKTIHTFQGSEEDTVVYVVGKAGRQHWQHVYTAITRGRSQVYVIAEESQLRKAVRQNSFPRRTRLKHFLQREFADSYEFPKEASSPSKGSHGESKGHSTQPMATPSELLLSGTAGNTFLETHGSEDEDGTLITNRREKLVLFEEPEVEEDPLELRGTKRRPTNDCESPNKLLLVEETSPLVSARFQNMTLKNLTPKQLFKTAGSEGT